MTERLATYRLQLSPAFTFTEAAGLTDYLASLGVSHLHLSPCLEARAGSAHGYDVVDPTRMRRELGGEDGFNGLADRLRRRGLRILLDFVPNHMAASHENPWWWDVLSRGQESRYAHYFDIDWRPRRHELAGKVVLPVLATSLPDALASGELRAVNAEEGPLILCGTQRFPIAEGTLDGLEKAVANPGAAAERTTDPSGDATIAPDPSAVRRLLERQHYFLTDRRSGLRELNYRRFANVSGLVGMRVEEPDVFEALHSKVFDLVRGGSVDGLRIDHVDGLRDPAAYLERLRSRMPDAWIVVEKVLTRDEELRPDWPIEGTTGYDNLNRLGGLFIDSGGEAALTSLYAGFTGAADRYRELETEKKLLVLERLFPPEVDRLVRSAAQVARAHGRLREFYEECGGAVSSGAEPSEDAGTAPDPLEVLLRTAVRALAAAFPVYRTYVSADSGTAGLEDAAWIDRGIDDASRLAPEVPAEAWVFLRDLMLLRYRGAGEADFAARFQQLTGPTMAKGAEDTAFYCYNRLVALNEVGGDPSRFGVRPDDFHRSCVETARAWPHSLAVVSTHDTKRSADARVRIALLSSVPDQWGEAVRRWTLANERHKTSGMPDRNDEYLFYQTLVGVWPIGIDRMKRYARKAVKEAKRRTAWIERDEEYDLSVASFVERALSDRRFVDDLGGFVRSLDARWKAASLSQTLLHLTAAGVPQIYQGDELWSLSLVDPDNRRPVDFEVRREAIRAICGPGTRRGPASVRPEPGIQGAEARSVGDAEDGAALEPAGVPAAGGELLPDELGLSKLRLIRAALEVRRLFPDAFGTGSAYSPLRADGPDASNVLAYQRSSPAGERIVAVALRFVAAPDRRRVETYIELPAGEHTDVLGGGTFRGPVAVGELLAKSPVALLVSSRHQMQEEHGR